MEPYACTQIVHRACLRKDWIKNDGKIKKQAFFRLFNDHDGISVAPSAEACSSQLRDPIFGTITLHVGRVRTLGLDVIPDSPAHANIQDVPRRDEDDTLARTIAEDLAAMARPCYPR